MTAHEISFGVRARWTQHELADEAVEELLQLVRLVRAVHDVSIGLRVHLRLRAELVAEVLARVCGAHHQTTLIET